MFVFFLKHGTMERGVSRKGVTDSREHVLGDSGLGWTCSVVLF